MQQALCTDAASSPHACARARVTCGRARRGQGVLELASGARYEGDFVEGAREGFGELVFPAGTGRYCGSFSDGQQDGWGEMAYANGDRRVPPLHLRHRPTHARARSLKTSLPAQVRRRLEGRATARARHHALRKRHGGAGRVAPRRPSGAGPAAQRGCARQRLARACARARARPDSAARRRRARGAARRTRSCRLAGAASRHARSSRFRGEDPSPPAPPPRCREGLCTGTRTRRRSRAAGRCSGTRAGESPSAPKALKREPLGLQARAPRPWSPSRQRAPGERSRSRGCGSAPPLARSRPRGGARTGSVGLRETRRCARGRGRGGSRGGG